MGVRVRLTRNSSAYFPFWLALPVMLFVALGWLVAFVVIAVVWVLTQLVKLAVAGFTALASRRPNHQPEVKS